MTVNSALNVVRNVRMSLQMLFTGRAGLQDMGGPVLIVKTMSDVAAESETAWIATLNLLNFGAMIAINLAVMNMLPIPALDGGHLMIYLIEVVRRKPMKKEVEGIINFIGLVIILALAVIISIKDIISL